MSSVSLLSLAVLGATAVIAHPHPVVDTAYPYNGPAIPIGDWVDQTVNGNGQGFPRLVEPPAVSPQSENPTNNINVISLAYLPDGMSVHFQTPFGIGCEPEVKWGTSKGKLDQVAKGYSRTYDRTPSCSEFDAITQCSQFFHEVLLPGLTPATTYYYQIPGGNGTSPSSVLSFTTAPSAGSTGSFSIAMVNDMGYTNAAGTHLQLRKAVDQGVAFVWHGGDISYADDWYSGILPCADDWPVCYNGTSSELPGGVVDNPDYLTPLPEGEIANQGGPLGGDMSTIYESNWDLWQQWMDPIFTKVPYMVNPGNHEATCAEFDGPMYELSAYLDNDQANSTSPNDTTSYYSCPPSQRNFTAYQHRFRMPGAETGGVSNFWYSFDYGLAHFISFSGETDFYQSPEYPFVADLTGNETHPTEAETYLTDSGPFGYIDGSYKDNQNYEQYKWLEADLAAVDRSKTPWVFAMSHRPMYSTQVSSYQTHIRNAFEALFLEYGVDAYIAGHIHWYERMIPMGFNGTIDYSSVVDDHTYLSKTQGGSMTHIVNGQAGNIESHTTLDDGEKLANYTKVLDDQHYGFTKLTVVDGQTAKMEFIRGKDGSVGDYVTLKKE